MSIRRTAAAVAALMVTAGLSGCAVTGTNFQPGVAAEVGDVTISTDRVDEITTDYCSVFVESGQSQGQQLPLGFVRSSVAVQLMLNAAAEELAAQFDIEPGAGYEQAISQIEAAYEGLSEDQQEAALEFEGGGVYITAIVTAVGERLLADEGGATENPDAAIIRGQDALFEVVRRDAEINPVYDITISDAGEPQPGGSANVSVGVGDRARTGALPQPDPAYVASLPESQRCG